MSQIYFIWSNTLHVSDGLFVHHQDFKTVHTVTGICQTDTAICLLESRWQCLLHLVRFTIKIGLIVFNIATELDNCLTFEQLPSI